MNRRQFLKSSVGVSAFLAFSRRSYAFSQSPPNITKFAVSLPGLGTGGKNSMGNYLSVATPDTTRYPGIDYYEIAARKFTQKIHPSLPPTTFLGYADASAGGDSSSTYLGGAIVAKRGRPVRIKVRNQLSGAHPLPVDTSLMGAEAGAYANRICVHLHGGLVPWTSDGGPYTWFDPQGIHGESFMNGTGTPGEAVYDYPNDQSARLLWYHDHALGYTRLNAYAGLASAYIITDTAESDLVKAGVIPSDTIPLIIQDKSFKRSPDEWGNVGDLWYPSVYETSSTPTGRWDWGADKGGTPPIPSCVPEFFADTNLVNGAPYPMVQVAPKRYRLRILNGSQARFYNLQMYVADNTSDGLTLDDLNRPINPDGPAFIQIGTEGGLLPAPAVFVKYANGQPLNSNRVIGYDTSGDPNAPSFRNVNSYNLLLAPAERADLIVDFSGFAGSKIIMYSDAPAPFPGGDPRNDYFPGSPDQSQVGGAPTPLPGAGPDTRTIMRFDVGTSAAKDMDFATNLATLGVSLPIAYAATQPSPLRQAAAFLPHIPKTLNEDFDSRGRLLQRLGTDVPTGPNVYGRDYVSTPTEIVGNGDIQVWRIFNLTGDTHPMHFHLVNVQVVQRARWDYLSVDGMPVPNFQLIPGTSRGPDPNERGWKETVRVNPGEVADVIMRFDLPKGPVPDSPRLFQAYGIRGAEYVWHCHILEHEEHDMMRPLVVVQKGPIRNGHGESPHPNTIP